MTDQTLDDGAESETDEEGSGAARRWNGKRIVLLIVLPVLLLAGAGAGAYFTGLFGFLGEPEEVAATEDAPAAEAKAVVFYDLPELLVNLNTTGRRTRFLKMKVSLEVANEEDVAKLETVMPRIIDNFQVYLRELRSEDLRGSAGLYRLREELLKRVQVAAAPAKVNDVLFREMLIQ